MEKIKEYNRCITCGEPVTIRFECEKCSDERHKVRVKKIMEQNRINSKRDQPSILDGLPGGDIVKDLFGDLF